MLMKLGGALLVCALAATARASVAPTEGSLATRDGGEVVDVPLRHTEVTIRVTGIVADVEVAQTFVNPYQKKIDATYLFPLPTGAAVHDLAITTGGHTIAGKLVKRDEAAEKYRLARQAGHVAALLTEERPNLFTQSVANIEPGARVDVVLRFAWALTWADGGYQLAFPLVAGPRHVPASSKLTPEAAAALMAPVLPAGPAAAHRRGRSPSTSTPGVPIAEVSSPSHALAVGRPVPGRAHVELAAGDTVPNKDFILRWTVAGPAPTVAFAARRRGASSSSRSRRPASRRAPRRRSELLFVLDTSSSMTGAPLAKARDAIRRVIADLGPDDTFQILRFDDGSSALGPRALAVTPRNVEVRARLARRARGRRRHRHGRRARRRARLPARRRAPARHRVRDRRLRRQRGRGAGAPRRPDPARRRAAVRLRRRLGGEPLPPRGDGGARPRRRAGRPSRRGQRGGGAPLRAAHRSAGPDRRRRRLERARRQRRHAGAHPRSLRRAAAGA